MAKQTFTTGQVLTAAQMTSLQETAMGGGAATAKTANYTLVAADAGKTVAMDAATATTITVNTGLFAAGDTVFIQNLGAGVTTITAGTATVDTSSSLALAQYEGGKLYFVSVSDAIFFKSDGAAAAGGGMTLLNSGNTALSGNTFTISSIPSGYVNLVVQLTDVYASAVSGLRIRFNADSGTNYSYSHLQLNPAVSGAGAKDITFIENVIGYIGTSSSQLDLSFVDVLVTNYLDTTGVGVFTRGNAYAAGAMRSTYTQGQYNNAAVITELTVLLESTHTFSGGNIYLYGVK